MRLKSFKKLLLTLGVLALSTACGKKDDPSAIPATQDLDGGDSLTNIVCSPFNLDENLFNQYPGLTLQSGLEGELFYLEDDQPRYSSVRDVIENGTKVDTRVFFNDIDVPTQMWDRGFETETGELLTNGNEEVLYEYFGLKIESKIKISEQDTLGEKQLAVISDDGFILSMLGQKEDGSLGMVPFLDNDGVHPSKMKCADEPIEINSPQDRLPFEALYHQGPRYHISMVLMWRDWPENEADVQDPLCGQSGNSKFFDPTQNPPVEQQAFQDLKDRGWKVLTPENYELVNSLLENPCFL
jgi:hypothetical protein